MLRLKYRSKDTYTKILNYKNECDIIVISVEEIKKEDFVMTKKMMKVVAILLAAVLVVAFAGSVFATEEFDISQFKNKGDTSGASNSVTNIIGALINIIQIVGTGVAIIMLIVLAIKYISAAPGDKAEIKKHAVVYVVGAIVLFAATGILQIIKNFSKNIEGA